MSDLAVIGADLVDSTPLRSEIDLKNYQICPNNLQSGQVWEQSNTAVSHITQMWWRIFRINSTGINPQLAPL